MTVAAGLLMAPGLGSTSVGDSSAMLPIGDVPVGVRSAGCPDFAATPDVHVAARFESYANNDPVSSLTDQGTFGLTWSQATETARPTFRLPCESGKLNGLPCLEADGNDSIASTTTSDRAQPNLICVIYMPSTADLTILGNITGSVNGAREHDLIVVGADDTVRVRAGLSFNGSTNGLTANTYHSICAHFNTTSSELWIDGTSDATGSAGTEPFSGGKLFARFNDSQFVTGRIAEYAVWDSVSTASVMVADWETVMGCVYGGGFPQ